MHREYARDLNIAILYKFRFANFPRERVYMVGAVGASRI